MDININSRLCQSFLCGAGATSVCSSSFCIVELRKFVRRLNRKNPCDKTNGRMKLLGMSVNETNGVISTPNVVQKPIRYSPPQIKKYASRIVVNGSFSSSPFIIVSYCLSRFIVAANV